MCIGRMFTILSVVAVILTGGALPGLAANDKCDLAGVFAGKAAAKFKKDPAGGIKLFLKSREMCPDNPDLAFNLGLALYRYKSYPEAEKHLAEAVAQKGTNSLWLNTLAWVMLENRSDVKKALKYARAAEKYKPEAAYIQDTLLWALLADNQVESALEKARKARQKWPRDKDIQKRLDTAVDAYIAIYLEKTRVGKHTEAIAGLQRFKNMPVVKNALCWALLSADRVEAALHTARAAKPEFKAHPQLKDTYELIANRYIRGRYELFKEGQRAKAVMDIKRTSEKFPGDQNLKQAYEEMLLVAMEDTQSIEIPRSRPVHRAAMPGAGKGQGLLQLIIDGGGPSGEVDLTVDVHQDIPVGREKGSATIAVIIGNKRYSQYGHSVPDADYAESDAAFMRQYAVRTLGYKADYIIYEVDATLGVLNAVFGRSGKPGKLSALASSFETRPDILIYYSGHGAPGRDSEQAYLVPVDANAATISNSGYSLDTLYDNLRSVPANRVTVVIDACFSGKSDSAGDVLNKVGPAVYKPADPVRSMKNTAIFTSTGSGQLSHWYPAKQHSLFTYYFMRGIRGDADYNSNRQITIAEMKKFLKNRVPKAAHTLSTDFGQTPEIVADDEKRVMVRLK